MRLLVYDQSRDHFALKSIHLDRGEAMMTVMNREDFVAQYASGKRDFTGVNLRGISLSEMNLSAVNFQDVYLAGADLESVDLGEANLQGSNLRGADLSGAFCKMPISKERIYEGLI